MWSPFTLQPSEQASKAIKEESLLKISSSSLFELGRVKPTKSTADHLPSVPVFQEVLDLNFPVWWPSWGQGHNIQLLATLGTVLCLMMAGIHRGEGIRVVLLPTTRGSHDLLIFSSQGWLPSARARQTSPAIRKLLILLQDQFLESFTFTHLLSSLSPSPCLRS